MEDSWVLSITMWLKADMPTLEIKETKTQRKLIIVIDKMVNTLGFFEKKLEQEKEDSSNRFH